MKMSYEEVTIRDVSRALAEIQLILASATQKYIQTRNNLLYMDDEPRFYSHPLLNPSLERQISMIEESMESFDEANRSFVTLLYDLQKLKRQYHESEEEIPSCEYHTSRSNLEVCLKDHCDPGCSL